jgi:hypothetical protein
LDQAIDSTFAYTPDGTPLKFGKGGYGDFYRAGGWGAPEDEGIWSLDGTAVLRLQLRNRPADVPLALELGAGVLLGPKLPTRQLVLEANGRLLGVTHFSLDDPAPPLHFMLPPDLIGADGMLELRFRVWPVASPFSAGVSIDGRRLGIRLLAMAIRPANAANPHQ